jgi:hypothetical protein
VVSPLPSGSRSGPPDQRSRSNWTTHRGPLRIGRPEAAVDPCRIVAVRPFRPHEPHPDSRVPLAERHRSLLSLALFRTSPHLLAQLAVRARPGAVMPSALTPSARSASSTHSARPSQLQGSSHGAADRVQSGSRTSAQSDLVRGGRRFSLPRLPLWTFPAGAASPTVNAVRPGQIH